MKITPILSGVKNMFAVKTIVEKFELIPLVLIIGLAGTMGAGYSLYSLYQKPDVRLNKSSEYPPWETVDPNKPQKLFTKDKSKYKPIPELEKLKKEIGSYKT